MRPYLAIIKDSFREAVSSFMLWALLAILTFILLMLAPFSYSEQLVGELPWGDVAEWRVMLLAIKEGSQTDGPSPSKHIYEQLDGSLTKRIDRLWEKLQDIEDDDDARGTGQEVASICSKLHENLNELLEAKDFYDEAAWDEIELTDEAKELVAQNPSDLSQVRLQRRNRLLLEAAYPALVRKSMGVEFRPTWMGRTIAQVPLLCAPAATTKEAVVEWY
mgnify:FL=1